jgi:hypothetical protein
LYVIGNGSLHVIDAADPQNLRVTGIYSSDQYQPYDFAVAEDKRTIYSIGQRVDNPPEAKIVALDIQNLPSFTEGATVSGGMSYVFTKIRLNALNMFLIRTPKVGRDSFVSFDIKTRLLPQALDEFSTDEVVERINTVDVSNALAYLSVYNRTLDMSRIIVLDVSDPANIHVHPDYQEYTMQGNIVSLRLADGYIYLLNSVSGGDILKINYPFRVFLPLVAHRRSL